MAEPPSSPPNEAATPEDQLAWYKSQYEQLEADLADFRESSRELEHELEQDIERAEKQERLLKEKAETLGFEVEEWKRKYKESKQEAGSAQATLEKEITRLRDSNRTLHLKLRDIEVANDDFERQARNTTSSLEDMESKYNQAIERAVMMEEEIKIGEQEREKLRIEAQRVREEYADLKIEAELLQDKMKKQEARHLSALSTDFSMISSPTFDKNPNSPHSTASSPLITTPPDTKSLSEVDTLSELHDPPSPPMSDASRTGGAALHKTPALARKSRLPSMDITPKPRPNPPRMPGSRPSGGIPLGRTPARTTTLRAAHKLPASNSLTHIRTLTAQMQRLEARVQSARSKLPAPTYTPPRISPHGIPASVTVRSRKRTVGSTNSSVAGDDITPTFRSSVNGAGKSHASRLSTSGISRLSFGPGEISRPSSRASMASSIARPASRSDLRVVGRPPSRSDLRGSVSSGRPPSRSDLRGSISSGRPPSRSDLRGNVPARPASRSDLRGSISSTPRPASRTGGTPRPASRTDLRASYTRPSSRTDMVPPPRPMSRSSMSAAHSAYASASASAFVSARTPMRPRSSMSGPLHSHAHSSSVSHFDLEEEDEDQETPSRRVSSGIPVAGRRLSRGVVERSVDLGETY